MLLHKNCVRELKNAGKTLVDAFTHFTAYRDRSSLLALQDAYRHYLTKTAVPKSYLEHTLQHAKSEESHLKKISQAIHKQTDIQSTFSVHMQHYETELECILDLINNLEREDVKHLLTLRPGESKVELPDHLSKMLHRFSLRLVDALDRLEHHSQQLANEVHKVRVNIREEIAFLQGEEQLDEGFENNIKSWL